MSRVGFRRWVIPGVLGLSAGAGSTVALWSRDEHEGGSSVSELGRAVTRSLRSCMVVATIGFEYKRLSWRFRDRYEMPEYREERRCVHGRSARRLLELCNRQGGLYLKMGQHVASMRQGVPTEYTSVLVALQDRCGQDPIEAVERVWRQEFGTDLSEVFAEFDKVPIASASLAQVHRAKLRDTGETVAVKVQHPDLERNVPIDIVTVRRLLHVLARSFTDFDLQWIADEFERNIGQELDFCKEASNARKAAGTLKRYPQIHIPMVYPEWSSRRVLTMEFIQGCRVTDLECLRKWNISPHDIARVITWAFADMTFVSGEVAKAGDDIDLVISN
eukprot:CAMPEP_0184678904 /NCGR_PEP_ID=MMETSP0312-20130426/1708_1 /TAXON_ID=31354 /ORGANISM="Compsopogon coeruleus, Strain SAG 36.94" /LENGTH=331 /DNA_ID=CAMNT_0027128003 /DNA_START=778 /DNA_END=1774 /DNA_ORIENTATION=+